MLEILCEFNGEHHWVRYDPEPNPIAQQWLRKIRHLRSVPLDRNYTGVTEHGTPRPELERQIMNGCAELGLPVPHHIDQPALNQLHSWFLRNQYHMEDSRRNRAHELHRLVHAWERVNNQEPARFVPVGWGEQEGPLRSVFARDPYRHYAYPLSPGRAYLCWSEFGKRPYDWFQDGLPADPKWLMRECDTHVTFRAQFYVCRHDPVRSFAPGWHDYWAQIRDQWIRARGHDWTELHQWGAIPLATPRGTWPWATCNNVAEIRLLDLPSLGN